MADSKRMKLFSIYTDEIDPLKKQFVGTIQDDWELNIAYWGKAGEGDGKFGTPSWYNILRKRNEYLLNVIKENWGDIIIWADIDIQFFAKCTNVINKSIEGKDIVFMSEHWPQEIINGGFMVIRCNDKTLLLFQSVLQYDLEKLPHGDQTAINDILRRKTIDIKWGILPEQFWAKSHGGEPPINIVVHHANCAETLKLKLKQLKEIRNLVMNRKKRKYLYIPKHYTRKFVNAIKRNLKTAIRKLFSGLFSVKI